MMNQEKHNKMKFKTTRLKSSLCDYTDAYIHVKNYITINITAASDVDENNTN